MQCLARLQTPPLKELCYTFDMQTPRPHWSDWASQLRRLRLESFAAWLLEAGAPLALLGAQAFFAAAPFLGPQSEALARLLEDDEERRVFVSYLRGELTS